MVGAHRAPLSACDPVDTQMMRALAGLRCKSGVKRPEAWRVIKEIVAEQKAEAKAEAAAIAQQLAEANAAGYETIEDWKHAQYDQYVQQLQAEALGAEPPREQEDPWTKSILDGSPDPAVPPTAEPVAASSEQFHVATFEKAVEMLKLRKQDQKDRAEMDELLDVYLRAIKGASRVSKAA
jgi:hypothetical protein